MKRVFACLIAIMSLVSVFAVQPAQAISSDPKMFVSADNTFYAYVKAGETIGASFIRVNQDEPFNTTSEDVTITLDGPGAEQQKCIAPKNVVVGQGCTFPPVTAQKSGIWRIQFDVPATAKSYDEVSPDVQWGKNLFNWNITVKYGNDEQHGRIWTERYAIRQPAAANFATDFIYYYMSEDGYIYRANYKGYNGQISTLSADGIGIRKVKTCESAYQSVDVSSDKFSPALGSCGSAYKLFFEEPAGNLPTTAPKWDGKNDWVRPNISRPSIGELKFTADDSNDQQSGTVAFVLKNFIGQYDIKIDVEGDGSFDGQDDVTIHQQMKRLSNDVQKIHFDGTDKSGRILARDQKIGIKVAITKVAEIHLVAADVEGRTGGLELFRLSGDNAPTTGLCWNDTELAPLSANLMPQKIDGRDCADSTGGVHGWANADFSWGNARYIDDWVYATAALEGSNQIVYPNEAEAAALTTKQNIVPVIIAVVVTFIVIAVIIFIVIRRPRKNQLVSQPPQYYGPPPLPPAQPPLQPPSTYDGTPPRQPPMS